MTVEITSKIVGYEIANNPNPVSAVVDVVIPDDNPLTSRIESRPEGSLEAVSEKISMVGAEGKKKLYVVVSFMPVTGMVDGKELTIERPIEFFIPSGQLSTEHQWVTATMRSLSLAARGGYATQALQDLRKVAWDKGLVRCGWNKYGKPAFHDSEVAAIAWSIQQILFKRGFLDEDGFQAPLEHIVGRYTQKLSGYTPEPEANVPQPEPEVTPIGGKDEPAAKSVGKCPECSSDLVLMDGCPTCVEGCGWSKCG